LSYLFTDSFKAKSSYKIRAKKIKKFILPFLRFKAKEKFFKRTNTWLQPKKHASYYLKPLLPRTQKFSFVKLKKIYFSTKTPIILNLKTFSFLNNTKFKKEKKLSFLNWKSPRLLFKTNLSLTKNFKQNLNRNFEDYRVLIRNKQKRYFRLQKTLKNLRKKKKKRYKLKSPFATFRTFIENDEDEEDFQKDYPELRASQFHLLRSLKKNLKKKIIKKTLE